jgi:hypothetical protein
MGANDDRSYSDVAIAQTVAPAIASDAETVLSSHSSPSGVQTNVANMCPRKEVIKAGGRI